MPPLKHSWKGAFFRLPVANHLLILLIRALYLHNSGMVCIWMCLWPEPSWCLSTRTYYPSVRCPDVEVASTPLEINRGWFWKALWHQHSLTPKEEGTSGKAGISMRSRPHYTPLHIYFSAHPLHRDPWPKVRASRKVSEWKEEGKEWNQYLLVNCYSFLT